MPAKGKKPRNFPRHSLEEALALPQKIQDDMAGKPYRRLLLADALVMKPSSSEYRDLLSSAFKYGLTDGTEKASEIALTPLGEQATQTKDAGRRRAARRKAAMTPDLFSRVYTSYADKKLPPPEVLSKILVANYDVPPAYGDECAKLVASNGRYCDIVRDIGGSPHVLIDAETAAPPAEAEEVEEVEEEAEEEAEPRRHPPVKPAGDIDKAEDPNTGRARPIFVGHGKNKAPLGQLQRLLTTFQIPHKVATLEANLGRPIPTKVKETMQLCGSAILIFTKDEKFFDENGAEIWRPSENVVHELGAASFLYEDRIVIFKEEGIHFPANYQSIGYIEFTSDSLDAKTAELLKELIGFGLVKITPA